MDLNEKTFIKNDELATEDLGEDGFIILNLEDEYTHVLNNTGSFLWNCIDGVLNVDEIIKKLIDNLEDNNGYSENDIVNFCNEYFENLLQKNLIYEKNKI
jgi:hypothetical protein